MATSNRIAEVASAVGEPARAAMLAALMDGLALTANELAGIAAITPQTASGHLARLVSVGLIAAEKQGRHRYHRLAGPEVARMIESVMQIAGGVTLARPPCRIGPKDAALRQARTCYDHLAGGLGVSIADALRASGAVEIAGDAAALTESGRVRMQLLGILAPDGNPRSARPVCRPCLDWSERPPPRRGSGNRHLHPCAGSGLSAAAPRDTGAGDHAGRPDRFQAGLRGRRLLTLGGERHPAWP